MSFSDGLGVVLKAVTYVVLVIDLNIKRVPNSLLLISVPNETKLYLFLLVFVCMNNFKLVIFKSTLYQIS